tara:strand:- start:967 stop:2520 length:1554 start_codon:yes stop_codon:yes gene_type:complete
MADYVFIADPGFDRRILEDEEKNRVFVNSQAEFDYYTAQRAGGPFNGSYWKDVGSAGVITQEIIDTQIQASGKTIAQEYKDKESAGDTLVNPDVDFSTLNLYGPDGQPPSNGDAVDTNFGAGSTSLSSISKRDMPIPTGAEFWNVDGNYYIVYFIPGTGTPIYYDSSLEDLENLFGPIEFPEIEKSIKTPTAEQWASSIRFGDSLELADPNIYDPSQSPWVSFVDTLAKEARIRPWLNDEEMVLLLAEATLEGRTVTDAEWQSTNWWRTHTQEERNWLLLAQSDTTDFAGELPADAQRKIDDDRLAIENLMEQSGIANPSDELINWVAQRYTTGVWSEAFTSDQITILADPTLDAEIDEELDEFITSGEVDYDTTRAGESQVKRLVKEYLGPVFGANITDMQINKWASMVRNDPDAEINIKDTLLNMKKGLYPGYNDELTYEEIAAPWRGFTTNTWGGTVDETSSLFQDVVKSNDVTKATKLLYDAGLKDGGSDKIKNQVLSSMVGKFGAGGVRRII